MQLENIGSNPCVVCGPANPVGLRLRFASAPDGATAEFLVDARWQGFPGRLHSAILYLALVETLNWSLYARTGRMGLPERTSALRMTRRVGVGDALVLRGRVARSAPGSATVEAEATMPAGEAVGSLDRDYAMVDEATFLARMGYDALPEGYEGLFGP